jgi:hypothetical protein
VLERRLSDRGDSDKGMGIVDFQTSFIISYFVGCAPAPKFYETRAKRGFASRCFLEPEDGIIDGIRAMLAASVVWLVILPVARLNKSSFSSSRHATCKCHPISGKQYTKLQWVCLKFLVRVDVFWVLEGHNTH